MTDTTTKSHHLRVIDGGAPEKPAYYTAGHLAAQMLEAGNTINMAGLAAADEEIKALRDTLLDMAGYDLTDMPGVVFRDENEKQNFGSVLFLIEALADAAIRRTP